MNLSLVSLTTLSEEWLDSLEEFGVTSIDLAPSHFLDPSSSFREFSNRKLESIKNRKLEISSIQGLLYEINPEELTLSDLRVRIDNLFYAANFLGVTKLVLGAPIFRKNEDVWNNILELFQASSAGTEISLGVENICLGRCSSIPFGPAPLDQMGFEYVLDVSNALDCSSICFSSWLSKHEYSYLHLAGRNHSVPHTLKEYTEIREIIKHFENSIPFTWEFGGLELSELSMILGRLSVFASRYEELI